MLLLNPAMADVSDLVMLRSWYCLEENLDMTGGKLARGGAETDPSNVPVTVKRDWVEEGSDARDLFLQDRVIVDELFQIISSFVSLDEIWVDHFIHDLVDRLYRPRLTSLSLVFATRLIVDVQRTLQDIGLVQGITQVISTVRGAERWCECNLANRTERVSLHAAQKPLSETLAFTLSVKQSLQAKAFKSVLARWPTWCGLISFVTRMRTHHAGEVALNASYLTMSAAHVYNMLQQEKVLRTRWHDMEFLIQAHTPEFVFAGDFPRSRSQYVARWKIVHGLSITGYGRRESVPRFGRTSALVDRQIPILKELFSLVGRHEQDQIEKLELMLLFWRNRHRAGTTVPRDIAQLRKAGKRLERISSLEMLVVLEAILRGELPQMFFDPFGLCRSCRTFKL